MSDIVYFQHGDVFLQGKEDPATRHKALPVGTYLLRYSMEQGFFLETSKDFELPKKLYGNLKTRAEKILTTFEHRRNSTGVHLSGEKGSGKTLLSKLISIIGQERGISTIIVNFPAGGDGFNTFLQNIDQPVIVLFDEFEKIYDEESQQLLLTLLDGLFTSKKLFLLTSNNYSKINDNMKNRPGRIFYYLNFEGLEPSFVQEYGEENLKNKQYLHNLIVLASFIKPLNFDMLQAVVEESNRYNEAPMDTLEMLNVKTNGYAETYIYKLTVPNKKVTSNGSEVRCNPLQNIGFNYSYEVSITVKGKIKVVEGYNSIEFEPKDLVGLDGVAGYYEYKSQDGSTLILQRREYEATGLSQIAHLLDG